MANRDFITWLSEEINPGMEPTSLTIERLCAINAAFGITKCIVFATGPENPLCYISGGIGLACAAYTVLSWLF